MVYFQINKKSYALENLIHKLNRHLTRRTHKIFILFYKEGCEPCNLTRPEWSKLKNVISSEYLNRDDIVIAAIDSDLVGKLKKIGNPPNAFPTMRYITNNGLINENYEDSDISKKDRTIDSFVEWIELKTGYKNITQSTKSVKHTLHKTPNKKIVKSGGTRKHSRIKRSKQTINYRRRYKSSKKR